MEETSNLERADIKTRFKKGQSGNPKGSSVKGAGATLTGLARTMLERPVERADAGQQTTRLVEYVSDIVRRADSGDLKCRMFLLQCIDRGDRRKLTAQRNAKKSKNEDLRKFEQEKATEISPEMGPLTPETIAEQAVPVSPTTARRVEPIVPARIAPPFNAPSFDSSALRRDPRTGHLLLPDGGTMSPEEEERLANPYWPNISPHLKKEEQSDAYAGLNAGSCAGQKTPAAAGQASDSKHNFGDEKFSHENALAASGPGAARLR